MRALNHVISRRLVDTASATHRRLALEDLEGIRQRTKVRKAHRYAKETWAFYQLRQFVTYKAEDAGIPVVLVDPAYTSQDCHCCGARGQRHALQFVCLTCGYSGDADHNGACNVAKRGAESNAA
jgi:IS605 OrfB family transposase